MFLITFTKYQINLTYKIEAELYRNSYFANAWWYCKMEYIFSLGLSAKFWDKLDLDYDGHMLKGFTLLGLSISKMRTYECEQCDILNRLKA